MQFLKSYSTLGVLILAGGLLGCAKTGFSGANAKTSNSSMPLDADHQDFAPPSNDGIPPRAGSGGSGSAGNGPPATGSPGSGQTGGSSNANNDVIPTENECQTEQKMYPPVLKCYVSLFPNGNPANGPMNHDLCIASSTSATCQPGTTNGVVTPVSSFQYGRCYDNQAAEDKLRSILTSHYNSILCRHPDASGMQYWINQVRASAVTVNDVYKIFMDARATDPAPKPLGHLSTRVVASAPNQVLKGTASNVLELKLYLTYKSSIPAERTMTTVAIPVSSGVFSVTLPAALKAGKYSAHLYDRNVKIEFGELTVN